MHDVYVWDWFIDSLWWDVYRVDMKCGGIHGTWMVILGMVLAWCTILFFYGFGEVELWLIKYEIRMRGGYKDWHDIDMCGEYFMINWICIVCGQCVNPWDL